MKNICILITVPDDHPLADPVPEEIEVRVPGSDQAIISKIDERGPLLSMAPPVRYSNMER